MKTRQMSRSIERKTAVDAAETDAWIENEVVGCEFPDVRHGKRLRQLLEQLSSRVGGVTPWACQHSANTKAAYRFFGNDRISEANILAGHFASTRERFVAGSSSPVLVLHDTTEFSYRHEDTAPMRIDKAFDWNFLGALDDEYCLIVHAILFAHLPQALVLIDGVF
jgi:hypothetical protein